MRPGKPQTQGRIKTVENARCREGPHGRRQVLITDGERTVRTVLTRMLQADGYRVVEAERGEKCLFLSMAKPIDAFLIDL